MNCIERLQQSLRACDGCSNDYDYICECRPVDVRGVLSEVKSLRELVAKIASDATLRSRSAGYHARRISLMCGAVLAELDGLYSGRAADERQGGE